LRGKGKPCGQNERSPSKGKQKVQQIHILDGDQKAQKALEGGASRVYEEKSVSGRDIQHRGPSSRKKGRGFTHKKNGQGKGEGTTRRWLSKMTPIVTYSGRLKRKGVSPRLWAKIQRPASKKRKFVTPREEGRGSGCKTSPIPGVTPPIASIRTR